MKRLHCILGLSVAVCVVAAGCGGKNKVETAIGPSALGINHTSQRLLVVSLHDAVQRRDYDAMTQAMEEPYRKPFHTMLTAGREYADSLRSLADLVEQRIGEEPALRFRQRADRVLHDLMPSPLEHASESGKIDWSRVLFLDQGNATLVDIAGRDSLFAKQFYICDVKNGWFVVPRRDNTPPIRQKEAYQREAKYTRDVLKDYLRIVDDMKEKVRSGAINKDNYQQTLFDSNADGSK